MRELVVYGIGELGRLLGGGALRAGLRVTPITRALSPERVLAAVAPGTPVLIAVSERDLPGVLASLPKAHRSAVILLQNELFPSVWREQALTPSVLVPWVLQKKGLPTRVARPTPVFGAQAGLMSDVLAALSIPSERLADEAALGQALVDKYVFILTINALGLAQDRTLGTWLQEDPAYVWDLCEEATTLGEALLGAPIDPAAAQVATQKAMIALTDIPARGRSAKDRVLRALDHARSLGLELPVLRATAERAA